MKLSVKVNGISLAECCPYCLYQKYVNCIKISKLLGSTWSKIPVKNKTQLKKWYKNSSTMTSWMKSVWNRGLSNTRKYLKFWKICLFVPMICLSLTKESFQILNSLNVLDKILRGHFSIPPDSEICNIESIISEMFVLSLWLRTINIMKTIIHFLWQKVSYD